jgi:hypothetical protein
MKSIDNFSNKCIYKSKNTQIKGQGVFYDIGYVFGQASHWLLTHMEMPNHWK